MWWRRLGSEVALRKYEARLPGCPEGTDEDVTDEEGGVEEDEEDEEEMEVGGTFLVRGRGGPTNARGRTDLGGITTDGTSCLSLSISSGIAAGGGGEADSGGDGEGDTVMVAGEEGRGEGEVG